MGLINKKMPPKAKMKMPPKKVVKKEIKPIEEKIEQQIVNETVDEVVEEKEEQIVEQNEKEIVEEIEKTEDVENIEEIDVNAEQKNDVCSGEDLEEEEKIENEKSTENISEQKASNKKTTTKNNRKRNKKNNTVEINTNDENLIRDFNEAQEYISDVVNFTSEEWEKEKEELSNELDTLHIEPDLNPDTLKKLLSNMSKTYKTIKERLSDSERYYKSLEKKIKDIKVLNSVGSNANERNINAQKAVMFYKKNPDDEKSIDLELYSNAILAKIDFYKSCIDTMNYNRQLLITFASAFKIEINNY